MNEGDEGNMDDFLPKTIDRGGKRKAEEVHVRRSQEQFPRRSCPFANQPIASQSTNKGCGQILSFVIEVPVDEVGFLIGRRCATMDQIQHTSGALIGIEPSPCPVCTKRRVDLGGTKEQIQSALRLITDLMIDWDPNTCVESVDSIPDHHLREPSSYGYINPPESQPAGSYPTNPSNYGDSSTQPSIWGQANPSGRHPVPWPGSLFIHPSDLGSRPIQPAAQYQANPSGRHIEPWPGSLWNHPIQPAAQYQANASDRHIVPWPGSLWNHTIQPAAQYQADPSAMHPAPWPGSDLSSSSSANYWYRPNPSAMPEIPPFCDYHLPEPVACDPEISSLIPTESSQGSCAAPPFNNPILSEAGDEAYTSAMHASTSRKRQRKRQRKRLNV
ncbi:hypothetical protein AAG906_037570 [Vitis piasezkii]